jgi:hypothetical protein
VSEFKVWAAGLCEAFLGILRKGDKAMHTQILGNLTSFILCLTDRNFPAAMAILVPGGIVELTMGQMAKAGQGQLLVGLTLFKYLSKDPAAQERLSKPGMVDQLTKWIAKWLPQVRTLLMMMMMI